MAKRKRKQTRYEARDAVWDDWCKVQGVDAVHQQSTLSYLSFVIGWNAATKFESRRLKAARKGAK